MLSTITESLQQEEEYEDIDEESDTLPESLNIPGETVSNQSLNTDSGNRSVIYSEDFQSWWLGQAKLKENVRKVCDKYGQSLNTHVPLKEFMFDSNSKLLFCRNAKVNHSYCKKIYRFPLQGCWCLHLISLLSLVATFYENKPQC